MHINPLSIIRAHRARIAADTRRRAIEAIRSRFRVEDRDGRLVITLDDTAIRELPAHIPVSEAVRQLEQFRAAAVAQRFPSERTEPEYRPAPILPLGLILNAR